MQPGAIGYAFREKVDRASGRHAKLEEQPVTAAATAAAVAANTAAYEATS